MAFRTKFLKVIGIVVMSEVVYFVYQKIIPRLSIKNNEDELIVDLKNLFGDDLTDNGRFDKVLLFPDRGNCALRMASRTCTNPNCLANHEYTSVETLIKMIGMARASVHVSMYLFTNSALGDALVNCQEKDIALKVITDERNSAELVGVSTPGAQMGKLREAGIRVVCHASTFCWMHQNFMIIDDKVVVSGSFNRTNGGAMGNCENCIITSEPNIVQPFVKEFDEQWAALSPPIFM